MRPQADSRDAVHRARDVNSPAGLLRFDAVLIVIGREGAPGDSGYQDQPFQGAYSRGFSPARSLAVET
jgi:hypothetical protein